MTVKYESFLRKLIGTIANAFQVVRDDGGVVVDVDTRTPVEAGEATTAVNIEVAGTDNFHDGTAFGSLGLRVFNRIDTGTQSKFLRCAQWQVATKGDASITGTEGQGMRGVHGVAVHDSTGTVSYMQGIRTSISVTASGSVVSTGTVSEAVCNLLDPGFNSTSATGAITDLYYLKAKAPGNTHATRTITNLYGYHCADISGLTGVTNAYPIFTLGGEHSMIGGQTRKRTATAVSYDILQDDYIIGVTSTASARTIRLMSATVAAGKTYIIKDESGAAATNNITVSTEGSETIDGVASVAINTNNGSISVYSDGTNWFIY